MSEIYVILHVCAISPLAAVNATVLCLRPDLELQYFAFVQIKKANKFTVKIAYLIVIVYNFVVDMITSVAVVEVVVVLMNMFAPVLIHTLYYTMRVFSENPSAVCNLKDSIRHDRQAGRRKIMKMRNFP